MKQFFVYRYRCKSIIAFIYLDRFNITIITYWAFRWERSRIRSADFFFDITFLPSNKFQNDYLLVWPIDHTSNLSLKNCAGYPKERIVIDFLTIKTYVVGLNYSEDIIFLKILGVLCDLRLLDCTAYPSTMHLFPGQICSFKSFQKSMYFISANKLSTMYICIIITQDSFLK